MSMQIEIFTEGSGTTADPKDSNYIRDFFQGGFLPVKDLADKLESFGEVTLHIMSDEHRYLLGSDDISSLDSSDKRSQEEFQKSLIEASEDADLVIILLTTSTFKETVSSQWNEIVSKINEDSIWCLGASKGALNSIDIEQLELAVRAVILYQRVGVARIDTDSKRRLIDTVRDQK